MATLFLLILARKLFPVATSVLQFLLFTISELSYFRSTSFEKSFKPTATCSFTKLSNQDSFLEMKDSEILEFAAVVKKRELGETLDKLLKPILDSIKKTLPVKESLESSAGGDKLTNANKKAGATDKYPKTSSSNNPSYCLKVKATEASDKEILEESANDPLSLVIDLDNRATEVKENTSVFNSDDKLEEKLEKPLKTTLDSIKKPLDGKEPLESSACRDVLSSANKQAEPSETTLDSVQGDESPLVAPGTEIKATSSPSSVSEYQEGYIVGQWDKSGIGYRRFEGTSRNSCEGFGSWEKHTRGIGGHLLRQWGFQQERGLGKMLQGMTKPVEFSIQKGIYLEPPRKEDTRVLSICFSEATLGAAIFSTATGKLELLKDVPEGPPEMLTSLVSQTDPHVILVSAMQGQTSVEFLENLCGTADSGSRSVSLVRRPGMDFGLNSCVMRVKLIAMPGKEVPCEKEQLAKLSAYVDFTCKRMIRAAGALLKYFDEQGARIGKNCPMVLSITHLLIDTISPGQKIIKFFVSRKCTGYLTGTISKLI